MPTALIVEDEPEANQLLAMLVRLRGYETESAFTGGDALRIIDRALPDIVFLDLMLPDINGYDVCKKVKNRRETSGVPIVMVTARLAAENRVQGFRAGADDYIPKPYTPDQIFNAMSDADAWRQRLREFPGVQGSIEIDTDLDLSHLKQISHLRSLILERTPLLEETVKYVGSALVEVSQRALEWGRKRSISRIATLEVKAEVDRLELTFVDHDDWLQGDSPSRPEGLGQILQNGRFDAIRYQPDAGRLTLSCLFPAAP